MTDDTPKRRLTLIVEGVNDPPRTRAAADLAWQLAEEAFNSLNGGGVYGPPFSALPDDERAAHLRWARRALAHSWEMGHRGCRCDRPGSSPCRNPFGDEDAWVCGKCGATIGRRVVDSPDSLADWEAELLHEDECPA